MDFGELELRQLLSRKSASEDLVRIVGERVANSSMPWELRRTYWYFLYNQGLHQEVLQLLIKNLETKNRVPFDLVIELLAGSNTVPDEKVFEALIKGMKKQGALEDLMAAYSFDKWDSRFSETRDLLIQRQMEEQENAKKALYEKFEFLKNQRMTEQAGQVLARLRQVYPNDLQYIQAEREFREQWARDVVASRSTYSKLRQLARKKFPLSEPDQQMLKAFLADLQKLSPSHPTLAYDLAVGFWFMEEYDSALAALNESKGSAAEWLRAELLLSARRFVECLEQLNHLEVKFAEHPETSFAVSYLRAHALKELGQDDTALEILKSIVHVRPHYRSAHSLISEWSEGVIGE